MLPVLELMTLIVDIEIHGPITIENISNQLTVIRMKFRSLVGSQFQFSANQKAEKADQSQAKLGQAPPCILIVTTYHGYGHEGILNCNGVIEFSSVLTKIG